MSAPALQGQVILIIGAGREPGPALAQAFARQGAVMAVNDLSPVVLDPIVEQILAGGGQARAYPGDATRGMPLRSLLDEVLDDWGQINILVNNPRVSPPGLLIDLEEWDWQRTVEMNLNGPFLAMQLAARQMREQGQGVILNVVAEAGSLSDPGAAYQASQAGLMALTLTAANEFIAYNIRVHALCLPAGVAEKGADLDTLARQAVFLAGPEGEHLHGQVIRTTVPPP